MATFKVKYRRSSVDGKAGTVYYQVIHKRRVRHITTGIHISPKEWRAATADPPPEQGMATLRDRIRHDICRLRALAESLVNARGEYSADDIVELFRRDGSDTLFLGFMRQQADLLRTRHNGTARNYERTLSSFAAFMGHADIPLALVDSRLIGGYAAYLARRGVVRNTISFYMRNLRAVYNKAVRERLVTPHDNPFSGVYTGVDRTSKRAIDERLIVSLYRARLDGDTTLALARDLFIFSYCARGMAFVDIAYLRKSDIRDDTIVYARRKTGQSMSVRIVPQMRAIIDRHATTPGQRVFPIIVSDDPAVAYRQYTAALNAYNRSLKRLAEMVGCPCRLTSYTPRHSWASIAQLHNIPVPVISEGLGHTTEKTTRIYLAMLGSPALDAANEKITAVLDG